MGTANRFVVGHYYQFTGQPIILREGEAYTSKPGALPEDMTMYDISIPLWMDRRIRKCIYTDPFDGTCAAFDDIFVEVLGEKLSWTAPRPYACYLQEGMFQEIEING